MLRWTLIFLIIAIIAGAFGFFGIAAGAAEIAKILFFIFIVLFLISLIGRGRWWGRRSALIMLVPHSASNSRRFSHSSISSSGRLKKPSVYPIQR